MLSTLPPLLPGASRHATAAGANRTDPKAGSGFAELMQQAGSAAAALDDAVGVAATGPRETARSASVAGVHATSDAAIETLAALGIDGAAPRTGPVQPGLAGQATAADTTALLTDAPAGLRSRPAKPAATLAEDFMEAAADRAAFDVSWPTVEPGADAAVTTHRPGEAVSRLPTLPGLAPTGLDADRPPDDESPVDEAGSQDAGTPTPLPDSIAALAGLAPIPAAAAVLPAPTPSTGPAGPMGSAQNTARSQGAAGMPPVEPAIAGAGASAQRVNAAVPARPGGAAAPAPVANPDRRQGPADPASPSVSTPAERPPAGEAPAHRAWPDPQAPGPVPAAPPTGRAAQAHPAETRDSSAQVEPARSADAVSASPVLPALAVASAAGGPPPAGPAAPAMAESQIQAPLDSPGFGPALGAQISLFVRDGVQTARLQLNPGEMGPITVQIAIDGNAARVDFQADLAGTRAVIEASLPALAGALQDAGMTLAGGGVSQQGFGQRQPPQQPPHQPPDGAPLHRGPGGDAGQGAAAHAPTPARTRGLVDLVA